MDVRRMVGRLQARPRLADCLLAAAVAVGALTVMFTYRGPTNHHADLVGVIAIVGAAVPLIWRRRQPVVVLGVVIVFEFLGAGMNYAGTGWAALIIAAYSCAAYAPSHLVAPIGVATTVLVGLFVTVGYVVTNDVPWQAIISSVVIYALSVIVGDNVRRRRAAAAALLERAERAERERSLLADQQLRQERARLARELHDVVAHSVSLMTIQAAGARRRLADDPVLAEQAMRTVEETGRAAMHEMRRILGVLRDETTGEQSASLLPQPSLADLGELAARSELPVTVTIGGPLDGLPAAVELNAYRIVQEAITNIRRHAGVVSAVSVDVRRTDDAVAIEVVDNGRAAATLPVAGHGLAGMRERVGMFDGTLEVGPRHGGGWQVRARIPVVSS